MTLRMTHGRRRSIRLAVLFLNLSAVSAHAQDAAREPPQVFVTLAEPRQEVRGTLVTLTDQAVALVADGVERRFPLTDVARIERAGDPSWDRALVAGLAVGAWCGFVCGQGLDDGGQLGKAVVVNALVAAAIGWAFDRAHHGRTTIFRRPR